MRILDHRAALVIAGFGFSATPALADLSAQDLWDSWNAITAGTGQATLVGNETYSNGVLTVSDVTISMPTPDGGVEGTLGEIVFTEQGDGSVVVTMSDEYPIRMKGTDPDGEAMDMEVTMRQNGLSMVASGDPEAISYAFAAPLIEASITEFKVNDEPFDIDFTMAMNGTSGTYDVSDNGAISADSSMTIGAIAMQMAVVDPDEDVDFKMNFAMDSVSSTSSGTLLPFTVAHDLANVLRSGIETFGKVTMGPSSYSISVNDADTQFTMDGTTESGAFDFAMSEDGIRYGGENTEVAATVQVQSMPLPPFTMNIARSAGEVRMPLIATDTTKDFGMKMDLEGLTLSDTVWGMFDPGAGLPRDPANLTLDISGLGKWNLDITDPEAAAAMESSGEMPGQVDTIDINALGLSLLGAELTGSGAFTFNNAGPIPTPSGIVDLQLIGANGLIDTLITAGLVPEEQAMGARMMLGLFARPGDGEDALVSTIELQEDGSVLANGQRIR